MQGFRWTSLPVSFDGERWSRYPQVLADWAKDRLTELDRGRDIWQRFGVDRIAVGPDGTAWPTFTFGDRYSGLYVITPEAVAATE